MRDRDICSLGNDWLSVNFFTYADLTAGEDNALPGYTSDNTEILANNTNVWWLSHVQLESGTIASQFDIRPRQIEKEFCERFFEIRRNWTTREFAGHTGGMNHAGQPFNINEYLEFDTEKKWQRPEIALLGLDYTENLTGFGVKHRNEDGFTFVASHLTGIDNNGTNITGYMHVTGNYVAISELYTPYEEQQLGYDFHPRNDPPPAAT